MLAKHARHFRAPLLNPSKSALRADSFHLQIFQKSPAGIGRGFLQPLRAGTHSGLRKICPPAAALAMFACPDNLRVRASLTLSEKEAPEEPVFSLALDRCFNRRGDPLTLQLLQPDLLKAATHAFGKTGQTGSE